MHLPNIVNNSPVTGKHSTLFTHLPKQSTVLQFSAVAIGGFRYMGAFGSLVGVNAIELIPWLELAEIYSGLAMGLLEGFAIAFIFSRLRLLVTGSPEYKRLHLYAWLTAITLPLVALPYLLTAQRGLKITELFSLDILLNSPGSSYLIALGLILQATWSLVALAVPVLTLMAVGYADFSPIEAHKASIYQATELKQIKLEASKKRANRAKKQAKEEANPYPCTEPGCNRRFASYQGLNGHKGNCPHRQIEQQQQLELEPVSNNGGGQ